jgi:hypothetical protein
LLLGRLIRPVEIASLVTSVALRGRRRRHEQHYSLIRHESKETDK